MVELVRVDVKRDAGARVPSCRDARTGSMPARIRWLANVWRRSWKPSFGTPSRFRPAESAALSSPRFATLFRLSGVPFALVNRYTSAREVSVRGLGPAPAPGPVATRCRRRGGGAAVSDPDSPSRYATPHHPGPRPHPLAIVMTMGPGRGGLCRVVHRACEDEAAFDEEVVRD